eukprot:PhM_4_TR18785/c1_g2_i5/m.21548
MWKRTFALYAHPCHHKATKPRGQWLRPSKPKHTKLDQHTRKQTGMSKFEHTPSRRPLDTKRFNPESVVNTRGTSGYAMQWWHHQRTLIPNVVPDNWTPPVPRQVVGIIFAVVAVMIILFGHIFEYFRRHKQRYVRMAFHTLATEVLKVGLISTFITFFDGSLGISGSVFVIMEWTYFVLFFMNSFYLLLSVTMIFSFQATEQRWMTWETHLPPIDLASHEEPPGSKRIMYKARRVFRRQVKQLPMLRSDVSHDDVRFTTYVQCMQRGLSLELFTFRWQAWVVLAVLFSLSSMRQLFLPIEADNPTTEDRLLNIISYLVLVGYIPMALFIFVCYRIRNGLEAYLTATLEELDARDERDGDEWGVVVDAIAPQISVESAKKSYATMPDPESYIVTGKRDVTLLLMQIFSLTQQLYLGNFLVGMGYDTISRIKGWAVLLVPLASIPVVIYYFAMPFIMQPLTLLTCLGPQLCLPLVYGIAENPKCDVIPSVQDTTFEQLESLVWRAAALATNNNNGNLNGTNRDSSNKYDGPTTTIGSPGSANSLEMPLVGPAASSASSPIASPRRARNGFLSPEQEHLLSASNLSESDVRRLQLQLELQRNTISAKDNIIATLHGKIDKYKTLLHRQRTTEWIAGGSSMLRRGAVAATATSPTAAASDPPTPTRRRTDDGSPLRG